MSSKTKQITTEITVYYCDRCGKEKQIYTCPACRKAICHSCGTWDDRDLDTDYPSLYCRQCWEVGAYYREQMREAEEAYDEKIEQLGLEWREVCEE